MNAQQREWWFFGHTLPYDDDGERPKLEKTIVQYQRNNCYVKRFAWVMAMFPLLAIAGVGYEAIAQKKFPYDGSHPVITVLCEIGLASLIYLVVLAGLSMGHRKKPNQSREECRQLVKGLLESHLRKPHIVSLSGSQPEPSSHQARASSPQVSATLSDSFRNVTAVIRGT